MKSATQQNSSRPTTTIPATTAKKLTRSAGAPTAVDTLVHESFAEVSDLELVTRTEYSTVSPCFVHGLHDTHEKKEMNKKHPPKHTHMA